MAEVPQQPEPLEDAPGAKDLDPASQFLIYKAKPPEHFLTAVHNLRPRMGHGQEAGPVEVVLAHQDFIDVEPMLPRP